MDDGISDGLWKTYSFDTYAGKCVIVATAKAEEIDSYDNDDDLKIEVDTKDYGYNSSKSWNGDMDQSLPKTIVIDTVMATGSHTLKLSSRVTPLLCDVNVFSSTDGAIALDTVINDSAPSGSSNLLWKTFNFTCDAGPVAIYLSGSADEEPGWNHSNSTIDSTDDDELRIMVDNTDYGWATDSALVGNSLYGDVKTILLTPTLTSGQHSIKLYTRETPTVYRVLVYSKNGDSGLPVELSQFSVQQQNNEAVLHWITESEVENLGFNVFRAVSADSLQPAEKEFVKINHSLIKGNGNSSERTEYEYKDELPSADFVWYRLQDVSYNGATVMHNALRVSRLSQQTPQTFKLNQNYPNPFNPSTVISSQFPVPSYVYLVIYNLLGEKVRTLVKGRQDAGTYAVTFNAAGLASGVYVYQLKTSDGIVQTKKMILLR